MLIAAISDTHGYHSQLMLPQADVYVIAGDFTQRGNVQEIAAFNYWLSTIPAKHKIVIAGNHDFYFQRDRWTARSLLTNAIYLQDSEWIIDDIKFYGSPWQPRYFDWAFNLDRGEPLRKVWAQIPEDTDVLITHGPPKGFLDENTRDIEKCGCEDLLNRMLQLNIQAHVFGHIHEHGGCRTALTLPSGNTTMLYNVAMSPIIPTVTLFEVFPREE